MQISDDMVRVAAEAMATEAGDDPRALTYAREMKCTSHDREPKERWEFWVPFARAAISAALDATWRPIDDTPLGRRVLLGWNDWRDGTWCMEVGYASNGRRTEYGSSVSCHGSATHWMPLPSPPRPRREHE